MKKLLMTATMVLALFVLVPAAFADGLSAYVFNTSGAVRRVDMKAETHTGSGTQQTNNVKSQGDTVFDFDGHDAEDQDWEFKFYDAQGNLITTATAVYTSGGFSPNVIGDGVTYATFSPTELKLTVTK